MTVLSLDTNVLIDLGEGQAAVRQSFSRARDDERKLVMSALVWEELRFGMLRRSTSRRNAIAAQLLNGVTIVPFEESDANESARLRAELEGRGERIGGYDCLIAGHALARGWTMVTANTREFSRVPGLSLVDWRKPESNSHQGT